MMAQGQQRDNVEQFPNMERHSRKMAHNDKTPNPTELQSIAPPISGPFTWWRMGIVALAVLILFLWVGRLLG